MRRQPWGQGVGPSQSGGSQSSLYDPLRVVVGVAFRLTVKLRSGLTRPYTRVGPHRRLETLSLFSGLTCGL